MRGWVFYHQRLDGFWLGASLRLSRELNHIDLTIGPWYWRISYILRMPDSGVPVFDRSTRKEWGFDEAVRVDNYFVVNDSLPRDPKGCHD